MVPFVLWELAGGRCIQVCSSVRVWLTQPDSGTRSSRGREQQESLPLVLPGELGWDPGALAGGLVQPK